MRWGVGESGRYFCEHGNVLLTSSLISWVWRLRSLESHPGVLWDMHCDSSQVKTIIKHQGLWSREWVGKMFSDGNIDWHGSDYLGWWALWRRGCSSAVRTVCHYNILSAAHKSFNIDEIPATRWLPSEVDWCAQQSGDRQGTEQQQFQTKFCLRSKDFLERGFVCDVCHHLSPMFTARGSDNRRRTSLKPNITPWNVMTFILKTHPTWIYLPWRQCCLVAWYATRPV